MIPKIVDNSSVCPGIGDSRAQFANENGGSGSSHDATLSRALRIQIIIALQVISC